MKLLEENKNVLPSQIMTIRSLRYFKNNFMNTILIIDDEKEICESIKMILEYEGYVVDYSTSAQMKD